MIKKVNRNYFWCTTFVQELASLGVQYACISPGSRNTALTIAFSENKAIKSYVIIDERSSGFFALGLAKASQSPVAIVSTSGTAVAEFYPAIIEAYYHHVPLIVCTADRPPELLNCGANQTINQDNIFRNHIRWYFNLGLPELSVKRLLNLKTIAARAYYESTINSKGPVHLNFPFRKPFEPNDFTDEIQEDLIKSKISSSKLTASNQENVKSTYSKKDFNELYKLLKRTKKGLIIAGPDYIDSNFAENCTKFAAKLKYPILADGISQLRFGKHNKKNILVNFEGFLRTDSFLKNWNPELILHFGKTPTSKGLELFFEQSDSLKYLVNEFGDWYDPSNKAVAVIGLKPSVYCKSIIDALEKDNFQRDEDNWLNTYLKLEKISVTSREKIIDKADFPFEGRIIGEITSLLPDNSMLMISNSMPVRDTDYFAVKSDKTICVYNNRGASGIDGITSTALGIQAHSQKPTVLITGDLAFYYDLNGLLTSLKYKIPLVIVLVNNNGGGIFQMLPVSGYDKVFNDYFITPHNLNFSSIVKSYGGSFINITSWKHLKAEFKLALRQNKLTILQVKTNSKYSADLRRKYWSNISKDLSEKFQ